MYVLIRVDGRYVAMLDSPRSYTNKLQYAAVFTTRREAEANRCVENEQVVSVERILRPNTMLSIQRLKEAR